MHTSRFGQNRLLNGICIYYITSDITCSRRVVILNSLSAQQTCKHKQSVCSKSMSITTRQSFFFFKALSKLDHLSKFTREICKTIILRSYSQSINSANPVIESEFNFRRHVFSVTGDTNIQHLNIH